MVKKSKFINIIGSFIIGIVSLLTAYFGLFETGLIQTGKVQISILSEDASKVYDGTPLVCNDYSIVAGKLKEGHSLVIDFTGSIEKPGTKSNTYTVTVVNDRGDVIENVYDIDMQYGTLEILKRPLSLESNSISKEYDGTAISNQEVAIKGDTSLVDNHELSIEFNSELNYVGTTSNTFIAKVLNGEEDVTDCYEINKTYGTLEITKRVLKIKTEAKTKEYDGTPLTYDKYEILEGSVVEGESLELTIYGEITSVGKTENLAYARIYNANNINIVNNYEISYLFGILEVTKREIKIKSKDVSKVYDGTPLEGKEYVIASGSFAEGEIGEVTSFTSITNVSKKENKLIVSVSKDGKNTSSNYSIIYVNGTIEVTTREINIQTGSASKTYDGEKLSCDEYEIISDTKLLEGHTLSYEMNASIINFGKVSNTIEKVKIYDKDKIEVTANYKIVLTLGNLEIIKREIVISTGSAEKDYDGEELVCEEYELLEGSIVEGDKISVTYLNSLTDAGEEKNKVSVSFLNANDEVINNYSVTINEGTLNIKARKLVIETASDSKNYDAQPIANFKYEILEGELLENHIIRVLSGTTFINAGEEENALSIIIEADKIDVTKNYEIEFINGKLEILPLPIHIRTESKTKIYDGTPLTCPEYTITSQDFILEGQTIEVNMTASIIGAYVIQFLTTTLYKFNVQSDALSAYKAVVVILLVVLSAPVVREKLSALGKKIKSGKQVKEVG